MKSESLSNQQKLQSLEASILVRQEELQRVAEILARKARSYIITSHALKAVLIVLGAVLAAQGAASRFFSGYEIPIGVTSMILGLVIASLPASKRLLNMTPEQPN